MIQTSIVGFQPFIFQDVTNISTTRPLNEVGQVLVMTRENLLSLHGRQRGRKQIPTLKKTNMAESSGILKLARYFEGITMQMWRQLSGIFPLIVHEIWVRNTFWPLIIASRKCQEHLGEAETVQDRCRKILAKLAAFHPFFFWDFLGPKQLRGILWRLKKCLSGSAFQSCVFLMFHLYIPREMIQFDLRTLFKWVGEMLKPPPSYSICLFQFSPEISGKKKKHPGWPPKGICMYLYVFVE